MKQSPFREANTRSAGQETPTFYGTRRLPAVVTNTSPLRRRLRQLNVPCTLAQYFLKEHFAIILLPIPWSPLRGPRKWVRELAIPRYPSYPVSGGIPCLCGYTHGGPVLQVGGWAWGLRPGPVKTFVENHLEEAKVQLQGCGATNDDDDTLVSWLYFRLKLCINFSSYHCVLQIWWRGRGMKVLICYFLNPHLRILL
jgi:hypothetical protein